MSRYNIIDFVIDHKNHYTLWSDDDTGGFLLQEGKLVYGYTQEELKLRVNDICMEDFVIYQYCDEFDDNTIDCHAILEFWNCMSDLTTCLQIPFLGDVEDEHIQHIYRKLFYGCQFDEYQEDVSSASSSWSEKELNCLRAVVEAGKEILRKQWT